MTSTTLPQRIAAVLFDMDNTLVASESAWFDATEALWRSAGGDPTGKGILGGTIEDLVAAFLVDFPQADPSGVTHSLNELLETYLAEGVAPMPGAVALITRLSQRMPMTVASNSPTRIVRHVVAALGWQPLFRATLGTDDVARPKPAPDLYLAAARACGADIADCVVFEDSPMGAEAGRAAGAFVVTVGADAVGRGHLSVPSLLDPHITSWEPHTIP